MKGTFMAKVAIGNRAFKGDNRTMYLDNEIQHPVELDPNDVQDAVIMAQKTRLIRDGDYEGVVQLQAISQVFTTKKEHKPEKVGTRTVYVLTKNGQESRITDGDVLPSMQKDGFVVDRTEQEDIMA